MNNHNGGGAGEDLAARIRSTLCLPPFSAGVRLCSEALLSRRTGVSLSYTRKAYHALVAEGILVRRRGSGTFVRRVPAAGVGGNPLDSPEVLMPRVSEPATLRRLAHAKPEQRALRIGVVMQPALSPYHASLWKVIRRDIEHRGHEARLFSRFALPGSGDDERALEERLHGLEADGSIVWASPVTRWNDLVRENLGTTVFFGNPDPAFPLPRIYVSVVSAVDQAVRRLAASGCQSLLLCRAAHPQQHRRFEEEAFHAAADYCRIEHRDILVINAKAPDFHEVEERLRLNPPDGLYCADERFLQPLSDIMRHHHLQPGRNIAVITLFNSGATLPRGHCWSQLRADTGLVGSWCVRHLLNLLGEPGTPTLTTAIHPAWTPGSTHQLTESHSNSAKESP